MTMTSLNNVNAHEQPPKFLLSIVIVNYRTPLLVNQCLSSLQDSLSEKRVIAVVVDNNSDDDSLETINRYIRTNDLCSSVAVIENKFNGGFAYGNNIGIQKFDAEYYLLLNSDTIVRSGSIDLLIEAMKKEQKAGLISPRLEWEDGEGQESCFSFHTPISEFLSAAKTGVFDKILNKYVVAKHLVDKRTTPEWTSFACVLIRKSVFETVGLLDPRFFMYFEDAEFCKRARQKGYLVVNEPSARVIHLRGGSSDLKKRQNTKKALPTYYYESRARYFYITGGHINLLVANLLWCVGFSIAFVKAKIFRKKNTWYERQAFCIWTATTNPNRQYTHPSKDKEER